jgi:AhpD family alkylhydroperoxidase
MKSWMSISLAVAASLEPSLAGLVEIRASQMNGCANCINMHAADARGQTEQRIYLLPAWREAPCYTDPDPELAALSWTRLEAAYEALKAHFTEEERVKLTLMINVINAGNFVELFQLAAR